MVVVLPEPLTPTTRYHERLFRIVDHERARDGGKRRLDLRRQNVAHFLRINRLVVATFANSFRNARGQSHAKIGADQHVFQLFQRIGAELALGENARHALADAGG